MWGLTKLVSSPAAKSVDKGVDIRRGIKAILDAFDRYEKVADDSLKALVNEILTVHGDDGHVGEDGVVGCTTHEDAPPAQKRQQTGESPDDPMTNSAADV